MEVSWIIQVGPIRPPESLKVENFPNFGKKRAEKVEARSERHYVAGFVSMEENSELKNVSGL